MTDNKNSTKVIIIGAGMAGLSAALHLQQWGVNVLILEGRNRIGGRVCKAEEFDDIGIDLGASWIHGVNGNPLYDIAERLKLKMDVTDNPSLTTEGCFEVYDEDGKVFDKNIESKIRNNFEKMSNFGKQFIEQFGKDLPLEYLLSLTQEENMNQKEMNFLNWMKSGVEGWDNANLNTISARGYYWENENNFTGGDGFVADGLYNITNELAKAITKNPNSKILLEHQVLKIEYNDEGVIVYTNKGEFKADYAISTLTLGVMKSESVAFQPQLPEWKTSSISKIGFGLMNKIVLEFPEVFWNENCIGIGYVSNERGEFSFFLNLYPFLKRPLLMCFVAADFAYATEKWTDHQIIGSIMENLGRIYDKEGKKVPQPTRHKITRWGSDIFARGSYSYLAYGSELKDIEKYALPVGRLHFAGEATFKPLGFAHGAFLSGIREADRIAMRIKESRTPSNEIIPDVQNINIRGKDIQPQLQLPNVLQLKSLKPIKAKL